MKFAKKYVLIDQDNYQRLTKSNEVETTQTKHLFQHPDVKIAKKQHKRMEQIANDERLSDSEKLLHHSQALKRYLESFKNAIKLSKSQAILGDIGVKKDLSLATAQSPISAQQTQVSQQNLQRMLINNDLLAGQYMPGTMYQGMGVQSPQALTQQYLNSQGPMFNMAAAERDMANIMGL